MLIVLLKVFQSKVPNKNLFLFEPPTYQARKLKHNLEIFRTAIVDHANIGKVIINDKWILRDKQYQPSGTGGTRSPSVTPHRLQQLIARLIQNGRQGLERG